MSTKVRVVIPTLAQTEKVLGPAKSWSARCYEISCMMVISNLVRGLPRYGHWLGPVATRSRFYESSGLGFVQHGWVELANGSVVDPTRWVFEDVAPYIYHGKADYYDVGGNKHRMQNHGKVPRYSQTEKQFPWPTNKKLKAHLENYFEKSKTLCVAQLFWLGNQSPASLGPLAKPAYMYLKGLKLGGYIPADNWDLVVLPFLE